MKTLVMNYLGLTSTTKTSKTTVRALPASWYRSDSLYELERRAIFSKRWLLVTHKLRFSKTGDWVRFEEAGFSFFLCMNKEGQINGFHNVCRHRAFPVVTAEQGTAQIFACKYHGWSYGLGGQLAKASGYQDQEGFDKASNGLLPVHVHVDDKGFIWINLDASPTPEVPWSAEFEGVDTQERFQHFDFENYHFDHTWSMSGDYNWKTLADNYNECYHCALAHPDTVDLADLNAYSVDTSRGYIKHNANTKPEQEANGMNIASTFYFPNACMTVSPHFFYMMRCNPTSPSHSSMEYEVYRHNDSSDEAFERIDAMFKRILSEDKWLCNNAQKNLNAGVFVNGEMHPRMEKGPIFFQGTVRDILTEHRSREEAEGRQIWPARQKRVVMKDDEGATTTEDEAFCEGLECNTEISW